MIQKNPGDVTHGMTGTRLYAIWKNMIQRCSNPNTSSYKSYGARGIKVCDEWRNSSAKFMEWAVENSYNPAMTIDRIDNDGNYCPENCRFITKEENHAKMMSENLLKKTGIFSEESCFKSKKTLTEKYGKQIIVSNDEFFKEFESIREAARELSIVLNRDFTSVRSQIMLCLRGKCGSLAGYKVRSVQ